MAGILAVALVIVSFLIPNSLNSYVNDTPNEIIFENKENRHSVQAIPILGVAERASFNVLAAARQSARYSRRSNQLEA